MLQDVHPQTFDFSKESAILFLYTPFCGTCAEAEKMLNVAIEALPKHIRALSCDINFTPELARKWRVESVPCLVFLENGEVRGKMYAFQSASYLFETLKENV